MAHVFDAVRDYDWGNDAEFQAGLRTILQSSAANDPAVADRLTRRAQCYYFARKNNVTVDFEAYDAWLATQSSLNREPENTLSGPSDINGGTTTPDRGATSSQSDRGGAQVRGQAGAADVSVISTANGQAFNNPYGDAPTPASFEEICRMISEGIPVPGIKEIPDIVLEGQSSASSAPRRRKPWEAASFAAPAPASGTNATIDHSGSSEIPAWQTSAT